MDTYQNLLTTLARTHRDTIMIGRTNNLHAQPTTFGAKIAVWIEELMRHRERLEGVRKRVDVVQFGGAVGTLASLGDSGLKFREAVAQELGLSAPLSNWHNARDSMTEIALCLGNICASLARNAQNINSLGSTEIGELSEAGKPGRGRSTTMAHKRNPRAAEFAEGVARLGRHRAMGMVEIMGQEHDRCGGTWISEWMLMPETFLLTSGAFSWAIDLIERLEVHADTMRANIDMTNGLALTERFTMALAKHMSKFDARQLLDEACARVAAEGVSLSDAIGAMPSVTNIMSKDEITALADPNGYVGSAPEIVDNVLAAIARKEKP
ncbi:MAG: 3-carboxy-cis,cis-muconate cycloisomerase [Rhodospirillaceae bacterium]|nr:3-carboxy-cis,cis-muconate cycloisomerase [Rhodospirillaceae bacterium]